MDCAQPFSQFPSAGSSPVALFCDLLRSSCKRPKNNYRVFNGWRALLHCYIALFEAKSFAENGLRTLAQKTGGSTLLGNSSTSNQRSYWKQLDKSVHATANREVKPGIGNQVAGLQVPGSRQQVAETRAHWNHPTRVV
jgi:hypothetical protein